MGAGPSKTIACTICRRDRRQIRPFWHCDSCEIYLCSKCKDSHDVLFENRRHKVREYPRVQICSMCPRPKKYPNPAVFIPFYCCECDKFYCGPCLKIHGRYPIVAGHRVVDLSENWRNLDEGLRNRINDAIRLQNDAGRASVLY